MGLYTRPQLVLVLSLLVAAGVGLGVVHWRAAHPQLVERLEGLDREIAANGDSVAEDREVARSAEPTGPRPSPRGDSESRPGRSRTPKRQAPPLDPAGPPLDLNLATLADLMRLPGVGPVLARRILETRETVGRFGAVDDLVGVRGVGAAKLERLRPFIGVLE
jgi:competence ComEA-like helix-hairpin-helix protein